MGAGTILLLTVLGASIFGGFDPRKKAAREKIIPEPDEAKTWEEAPCVYVMWYPAVGEPNVEGFNYEDFVRGALDQGRGIVTIAMCNPREDLLRAINEACQAFPDLVFILLYPWNIINQAAQERILALCSRDWGLDAVGHLMVPVVVDGKSGFLQSTSSDDPSLRLAKGTAKVDAFIANLVQLGSGTKSNAHQEFMAW